ncbi:hypothetical protein QBC33DRAFT_526651 [Phialemonium atrogriseum]|uniref:Uncharacterized protein n=1 Tax=Phialemonium atrogriseum TaxID=1093897 RepID=A0AAJ0FSD0_9PEZI|nr:uncharacterized protein QBC33DRAFT_526651 [Phialemonium atrogriseum]KAK1771045.1 hypothetical protein QBC33DRAFT_526651 [Phialemonium atrogriseum]
MAATWWWWWWWWSHMRDPVHLGERRTAGGDCKPAHAAITEQSNPERDLQALQEVINITDRKGCRFPPVFPGASWSST